MERTWSPQQQAIFEWGRNPESVSTEIAAINMKPNVWYTYEGKAVTAVSFGVGVTIRNTRGEEQIIQGGKKVRRRNLVVRARAGTGKTTTAEELLKNHVPEQRIVYCAFNNRIVQEAEPRFAGEERIDVMTTHVLGNGHVKRHWSGSQLDKFNERVVRLARKAAGGSDAPDAMVELIADLAGRGKNMAPFGTVEDLIPIALRFKCVPDEEWRQKYGWTVERVAQCARTAMTDSLTEDGQHDFDDMLFVPVANRWVNGRYDMVFIDEAQDMNACQIILAQKSCLPGGRIIVCGDDRQALYGFRGAATDSLDRLKAELDADELGLTVTYRCPKVVVKRAQQCVSDFTAADSAPEGVETDIGHEKLVDEAQLGDAVLSRKNAPLMKICLSLLRAGKRAKIEGKDVGKALMKRIKALRATNIEDLLSKLGRWRERELNKARALPKAQREEMTEDVEDTVETIAALCDSLATLDELMARCEGLFSDQQYDKQPKIVCSSVHKAKGLEWKRVFVLEWTFKETTGTSEEANIYYVAVTRSKGELHHVHDKALPVAPPVVPPVEARIDPPHPDDQLRVQERQTPEPVDEAEAALEALLALAERAEKREKLRHRHSVGAVVQYVLNERREIVRRRHVARVK